MKQEHRQTIAPSVRICADVCTVGATRRTCPGATRGIGTCERESGADIWQLLVCVTAHLKALAPLQTAAAPPLRAAQAYSRISMAIPVAQRAVSPRHHDSIVRARKSVNRIKPSPTNSPKPSVHLAR